MKVLVVLALALFTGEKFFFEILVIVMVFFYPDMLLKDLTSMLPFRLQCQHRVAEPAI